MLNTECIKPGKKLPVIFLTFVDIALLAFYAFTRKSGFLFGAGLVIIVTIVLYYIISKWNIDIDEERIVITGPMFQRIYLWKDVSATFITGTTRPWSYYWYFQSSSEKTFGFEVNYFTQTQLKKIAEIVIKKCAPSNVDIKIFEIAKGKFPWFII